MIGAIEEARGNVSLAASKLGIGRSTFYRYLKKYITAQDKLSEVREKRTDYVEDMLMGAIDKGNVTAMIFYLKTQAKDRGYIEREQREHMGKDGEDAINIKIITSDGP
jgi:hypothetical protein